ncbi:hypothetical protein C6N75_08585 [Streptomyces solincola]|uniref:LPXTG cell wall anchor domain-containing protein n=1 Tax=Streptomyces solincola TaxID=2100817 RepID=A0A2S9PZ01_9ACTN|nr:LAETG motif-containing sortase-dependent surface protein [Streptomyces solincola]PRH79628.1 hypothetical protein C6N75_08585 [Streptomyces solincola]
MSVARRPLLTATAAGTLLAALWFVPSANATVDQPPAGRDRAAPRVSAEKQAAAAPIALLAETGGVDTTPYLAGGIAFLGLGGGMVAFAVRQGARGAL